MSSTQPVSRNAPCPCGSGKKHKKCCLRKASGTEPSIRRGFIYASTFVLAFCSIVYELLLAQALSAFLGNTVLRYSVTIGLYMLSMGIGALLAQGRVLRNALLALQRVEILLTVIGGSSVLGLFVLHALGLPLGLFALSAHALIVVIGILTGLEIPLLIELGSGREEEAGGVLGVDYLGAFLGTIVFALLFYPRLGLIPTAFVVAALNAAVGVGLGWFRGRRHGEQPGAHRGLVGAQAVLLAVLLGCLPFSAPIGEFAVQLYLRH
jgi:spermidine synthase